jgi:hypothetical protein
MDVPDVGQQWEIPLTASTTRSALVRRVAAPPAAHSNSVSGASCTRRGYAQSLQSALDQAGIK